MLNCVIRLLKLIYVDTLEDSGSLSDSPIPNNIDEEDTIEAPSKVSDRATIDLVRSFFALDTSEALIEGKPIYTARFRND